MKQTKIWRLPFGLSILFEDRDIIVVDKPSGLLSIATMTEKQKTAHWILSEYLRKKGEKRRAAVVHRLDRDTSGVMLFVKSEQIKRTMMNDWDNLVVERKYIALVEGDILEQEGTINQPLAENEQGKMIVKSSGAPSITHWKCLGKGRGFSLVEAELETGRRNQIRAHFAWLGFPLAGDTKYGAKKDPLKRLALHAETLKFHHPVTKRLMEFSVTPDKRFFGIISPSKEK
ncbi:MAG: RNA pseudouridine synthase [Treponema sp.]|nr:RNA pseudouridine synthase [Treponema sp.]